MNDPDWKVELTKLVGEIDYRAELNRVRVSRVYEEVEALKSKVRILELDTEQDLALNKLGQMRASTKQKAIDLALNKLGDMSLPTYSRDGRLLRPDEPRRDAINRALNEGYDDGFADGFKEGQKHE